MKKLSKIAAILLAGSMIFSLAACSNKASSRNKSDVAYENAGYADDYEEYAYETTVAAMDAYAGENGFYEEARSDMSNIQTEDQVSTNTYNPASAMLIRRVNMNVETTDYNNVTNTVTAKVTALGGYVESSNASGTGTRGDLRNVTFVIRVPVDKLDELVNLVGSSCTVISSSENTEDVTLQYSDIQARIQSLRVEQQTLMNLLAEADSLEAIITLQNRLTEVRYEIEANESRGRVLENQSSYSTLTLVVREVLEETEPEEAKKLTFGEEIWEGLKHSFEDISEDGRSFVIGFVAALPYLLILAFIAVIIVVIIKSIIKSAKKKSAKTKAATAAAAASRQVDTLAPAQETPAAEEEKKTEE